MCCSMYTSAYISTTFELNCSSRLVLYGHWGHSCAHPLAPDIASDEYRISWPICAAKCHFDGCPVIVNVVDLKSRLNKIITQFVHNACVYKLNMAEYLVLHLQHRTMHLMTHRLTYRHKYRRTEESCSYDAYSHSVRLGERSLYCRHFLYSRGRYAQWRLCNSNGSISTLIASVLTYNITSFNM